ncbi:hypothetical protein QF011_003506 [Curtobacterium flaccumfaciens]|nr:hypothetical protein [Curtobacterium flaccumfaciens]
MRLGASAHLGHAELAASTFAAAAGAGATLASQRASRQEGAPRLQTVSPDDYGFWSASATRCAKTGAPLRDSRPRS